MKDEARILKAMEDGYAILRDEDIDTIKKALKKQIPTKPNIKDWSPAICTSCGMELSESRGDGYYKHWMSMNVCNCGQLLDWSEVN